RAHADVLRLEAGEHAFGVGKAIGIPFERLASADVPCSRAVEGNGIQAKLLLAQTDGKRSQLFCRGTGRLAQPHAQTPERWLTGTAGDLAVLVQNLARLARIQEQVQSGVADFQLVSRVVIVAVDMMLQPAKCIDMHTPATLSPG